MKEMFNNGTILQVEDTDEDIFLLSYAFKKAGILNPVQVVRDGQAAIDYLGGKNGFSDRARFPMPLLVLLDLQLPYQPGLKVLQWIRHDDTTRHLIVIILSSSAHKGDVTRAYRLGANAFLVKPADTDVLTDMCLAFKHFWIGHNVPGN